MTRLEILALAVILACCAALIYRSAAHPGWSLKGMDCVEAYAHARTAVDSGMVDQQRARVVDDKLPGSLRCGDLRRARALPGQGPSRGQPDAR